MNIEDPVQAFRQLTPDELLDAIDNRYLQGDLKCDGRFLALNSYENRVYQVGLDNGDNIAAKFYRPQRWSDEAILEEHRFTQDLEESEIPVIAPLADKEGNTLFHYGAFRYAVYPCRGGRAMEVDNSEHLKQMGRFVGRIHAMGAIEGYHHRPHVDIESYAIRPRQYLLDNNFIPGDLTEAYGSLTTQLIEQIQQCFDRAGTIRQIRLHGDFHPSNVLWTDRGPHIVDFDDARMGPAIQDLWMFLSGDQEYMTARLKELLDGYSQFFDFDPMQLYILEALRTMRMIYYSAWLASRWEDPAFPIAFPWFNSINYWQDQILSLREQSALMNEAPLQWI